jgi:Asp-tRNA(Asn)/Glu-tRNA(Gln) amidotransferase A subunit family amidase
LAAIERERLNCFSFVDPERARRPPPRPTCRCPSAVCPAGIKELDQVAGWPDTAASLVFKDRIGTQTSTGAAPARRGRRRTPWA